MKAERYISLARLLGERRCTVIGVAILAAALCGCGGGGSSGSPRSVPPPSNPPPPPPPPAQPLAGDPAAAAVSATTYLAATPAPAAEIDRGVILTKLDVMLATGATVGQVNAALNGIGASIAHMRAGSPFLTLSVPAQPSPQALAQMAASLEAQPGIAAAFPATVSRDRLLPPGDAGSGPDALFQLEHLLPMRFPAAWNAKPLLAGCEANRVPVLIPDQFAAEAAVGFGVEVPGALVYGSNPTTTNPHGHRVMTTLAAALDAFNPTGAVPFPQCLDVIGLELFGLSELGRLDSIADRFPVTGHFVLSYSQGLPDKCDDDASGQEACSPDQFGAQIPNPFARAVLTAHWQFVSRARWDDALVVTAAGNERNAQSSALYPGFGVAVYTSPLATSALTGSDLLAGVQDPALWGGSGAYGSLAPTGTVLAHITALLTGEFALFSGFPDYSPAPDVLTVGSTTRNAALAALAESSFSDSGPDVRAVGQSIYVLGEGFADGTSFAAPQVAGLAAYLWLLSPELRALPAQRTAALIRSTATTNGNTSGIIDAYAAVLSLDEAASISPSTARVRGALLDADENGGFDGLDLIAFAAAYGLNGGSPPSSMRDYSRYDLNGDGYTGSINTGPFDLDRVGSTQFGASVFTLVPQTIEGIDIELNELALSDVQILCYYAYSPLYQGAAADREAVLGIANCINANLGAALGTFTGNAATLAVTLTDDAGAVMPNVYVEFSASGGTVSSLSGTTDANGVLEVTATLDPGSTSMTVNVTARSSASGEILDQTVVQGGLSVPALLTDRSGDISTRCEVRAYDDVAESYDEQSDAFAEPSAGEGPPPPAVSGTVQASCNADYLGMQADGQGLASASIAEVVDSNGAIYGLSVSANAAATASIDWSPPAGSESRQATDTTGSAVDLHWFISLPAGVSMTVDAQLMSSPYSQVGVSVFTGTEEQAIRLCNTPISTEPGDWELFGDRWADNGVTGYCDSSANATGSLGPFVGPLDVEVSAVVQASLIGARNYYQYDPDLMMSVFTEGGAFGTQDANASASMSVSFEASP